MAHPGRSFPLPASGQSGRKTNPQILYKRILAGVRQAPGLIVGNVRHAQILEHLKQRLAPVPERHRAVVRVTLCNQYMAVDVKEQKE